MRPEVVAAVEELRRQFADAAFTVRDDGQGGAHVVIDPVTVGAKYEPAVTWIGFQIPAQYPYADIYPVFIGAECRRVDGQPFSAPVTAGHQFDGRPALQVSRRSGAAQTGLQKATGKVLKILDFLAKLP